MHEGRNAPMLTGVSSCVAVDTWGDSPVRLAARRSRGRITMVPLASDDASALPRVAALSVRDSLVRWVEAPFPSIRKARRVLPTLLDIELPFPIEECASRILALHKTGANKVRALGVAARNTNVLARIQALECDGDNPLVLDQEGIAAWTQALREMPDAGSDISRVVILLYPGHTTIATGSGQLPNAIHSAPPRDAAAIGRVLKSLLDTAAGKVMWLWGGPLSGREDIRKPIEDQLVQTWPGPTHVFKEPAEFLARALATRALLPGPLGCNLRAGEMAHPDFERRAGSRTTMATGAAAIAGLILAGCAAAAVIAIRSQVAEVDESFGALRDKLLGYTLEVKGARAVAAAQAELLAREAALKPFLETFQPPLSDRISALLQVASESDLRVESLSVSSTSVSISGTAPSPDTWRPLVQALDGMGYDTIVRPRPVQPGARIPFTIATVDHP